MTKMITVEETKNCLKATAKRIRQIEPESPRWAEDVESCVTLIEKQAVELKELRETLDDKAEWLITKAKGSTMSLHWRRGHISAAEQMLKHIRQGASS